MARKVFMSVLGANFYDACTYVGKNSKVNTRFVQEAVLKDIGAEEWSQDDVAYIMVTDKAKADNWNAEITSREKKGEMWPYEGLEKVLKDAKLKVGSINS